MIRIARLSNSPEWVTVSPGTLDVDGRKGLLQDFGPRLERSTFGIGVSGQDQAHPVSKSVQLLVVFHFTSKKNGRPGRGRLGDEIGSRTGAGRQDLVLLGCPSGIRHFNPRQAKVGSSHFCQLIQ